MFSRLFRHEDALWPTLTVISYILLTYIAGWWLVLGDNVWLAVLAIPLLAHSMVIAAYMVHEAAHLSVFKDKKHNRWFTEFMLWICGMNYSSFDDIAHKHNRHHSDRADIVSFDFRPKLAQHPTFLRLLQVLEWFYIPALELMMHALVIVLPFIKANRKQRRFRVATITVIRLSLFSYLAYLSLAVLWVYPLAYLLFLTVMRFMDVHQHTYELFETLDQRRGPEARLRDREFESHNTYSNLLSVSYPWLNLLVLNFCYHNVHHDKQLEPWYRLPKLHQQLYGDNYEQLLTFRYLMKSFHKYRIPRILNADPIDLNVKKDEGVSFIGVDGVSFLTAH